MERSRVHLRSGSAEGAMSRPRILLVSGNGPPKIDGVGDYTANLADELTKRRPEWQWYWLCRRPRWFHIPWRRRGPVRLVRPAHGWGGHHTILAATAVRWLRP